MGIASGEARRRKKQIREMAQTVLDLTPEMPDIVEKQVRQLGIKITKKDKPSAILISMSALLRKAMAGDIKALEYLIQLSGGNPDIIEDELEGDAESNAFEGGYSFSDSEIREKLDSLTDEQLRNYEQICDKFRPKEESSDG